MTNMYTANSFTANQTPIPSSALYDDISFNGYGIQNARILTEGEGFGMRDLANRRIQLIDRPQSNGGILNNTFFGTMDFSVQGVLVADDKNQLDDLIDEFKLALMPANKPLRWRVNGLIRKINATVADITFGVKENLYITFQIDFVSQDSFWEVGDPNALKLSGSTANTIIEQINNPGMPTLGFTVFGFKGTTNVTAIEFKINGIALNITANITSGDVLYIDSKEAEILLNGVIVNDYDGVFPEFENGSNDVEVNITGSYEADISFIYPIIKP